MSTATECEALDPVHELYAPAESAPSAWDRAVEALKRKDPLAVSLRRMESLGREPSLERLLQSKAWKGSDVKRQKAQRQVPVVLRSSKSLPGYTRRTHDHGHRCTPFWEREVTVTRYSWEIRHPSGATMTWWGPLAAIPDVYEEPEVKGSWVHGLKPAGVTP